MPELTFYGSSDDLIECEGVVSEEWNKEHGQFLVVCPDGRQAHVWLVYGDNGCWSVSYGLVGEDVPAPTGCIQHKTYTAVLTLDVPEKTTVHEVVGGPSR